MNEQWEWFEAPTGWEEDESRDIRERTFKFAIRVIDAIHDLPDNVAARVVVQQLVEAATLIGASVEEASGAASKQDSARKMSLAREKARGVYYWIRVIRSSIADSTEWIALQQESQELARILDDLINPVQNPEEAESAN